MSLPSERQTSCPEPPAALAAPPGITFYSDSGAGGQHSIRDPVRTAENEAQVRPLRAYLTGVTTQANAYVRSQAPARARCVLAWLDAWASAGALLGEGHPIQGGFERKWALGGLALAWLQIRDAPGLDLAARGRVLAWFRELAMRVRPIYDRPPGPALASMQRNNHMTWAGLAIGAAAVALDDKSLFAWAMERARMTLDQVTPDGHLPREMARGRLALHYHLFTLAPFSVLDRLARANGVDLDRAALARLVQATFAALADPSPFERAAGSTQDIPRLRGFDGVGLEAWADRDHEPALDAALARGRPFGMPWLGGDGTLLYGR